MPRSGRVSCVDCEVRSTGGFCSLGRDALEKLDALGDQVDVPAGRQLLREGFYPDRLAILCSGQVKVTITSRDGRVLVLRIAGPGDVLGMASVLRNTHYESTAETIEACRVKMVGREEFLRFQTEFSEVGRNSASAIADDYRLAVLNARRLALSGSAAGKLACVLVEWARKATRDPEKLIFTMPLTHEELANMAGISRETVTRLLTKFRNEKLIRMHGATLELLHEERLESLYS